MASSFAAAAVIAACNLRNEGTSPPAGALSYPIALAVSRESEPRFLYVANSNFDLRYNAGSVHVYDLAELAAQLDARGCRRLGMLEDLDGGVVNVEDNTRYGDGAALDASAEGGAPISLPADYAATSPYGNAIGILCNVERTPEEAACCFETPDVLDPLRADEMLIDSFATGLAVAPNGGRVYVSISSRSRLVYLDVDESGQLDCGGERGRCTRGPGRERADDDPDQDFPGQPSALALAPLSALGLTDDELGALGVGADTTFVVTAHELGGVGLFLEKGNPPVPVLESVLTGMPTQPTSLVIDPRQRLIYVSAATQTYISRVGVRVNDAASASGEPGPRELLYASTRMYVTNLSQTRDLRDLALDPHDPTRLFALVRGELATQETVAFLRIGSTTLETTEARLLDGVRIGSGPSKLEHIVLAGRPFLLVSCYDARAIFIIDTDSRKLVAMVRNLSGPYEMAFDPGRGLLYVADFRSSVLRVVDLEGLVDRTRPPPRIVATIGSPRFEGGFQ